MPHHPNDRLKAANATAPRSDLMDQCAESGHAARKWVPKRLLSDSLQKRTPPRCHWRAPFDVRFPRFISEADSEASRFALKPSRSRPVGRKIKANHILSQATREPDVLCLIRTGKIIAVNRLLADPSLQSDKCLPGWNRQNEVIIEARSPVAPHGEQIAELMAHIHADPRFQALLPIPLPALRP